MSDTAPKTDLRDDILATIDKTLRAMPGVAVTDNSWGWTVTRGNETHYVEAP